MTSAGQERVTIELIRLDPSMPVPGYAHRSDAGADLAISEDCVLEPGERRLVGTGLAIALPQGWAGFVHPRSGLAARCGLTIVNAPGTIDAGYRGEIRICLLNTDRTAAIRLTKGDRIAQLVLQRVAQADFVEVEQLAPSERAGRGHGSTGGIAAWSGASSETVTTEVEQ